MFLFVLICLAGFWLYASSVAANETAENPMLVFGKPVSPEQRKLGLTGSTFRLPSVNIALNVIFAGRTSLLTLLCAFLYSQLGCDCHLWRIHPVHDLHRQVRDTLL